jgi:hypothetical protein
MTGSVPRQHIPSEIAMGRRWFKCGQYIPEDRSYMNSGSVYGRDRWAAGRDRRSSMLRRIQANSSNHTPDQCPTPTRCTRCHSRLIRFFTLGVQKRRLHPRQSTCSGCILSSGAETTPYPCPQPCACTFHP